MPKKSGQSERENPFDFKGAVSPRYHAARHDEIGHFKRIINDAILGKHAYLAVVGARSIGKTSLLYKFFELSLKNSVLPVLVTLTPDIRTMESLTQIITERLKKSVESHVSKLKLQKLMKAFREIDELYVGISPTVGIGARRKPAQAVHYSVIFEKKLQSLWGEIKDNMDAIVVMIDEADYLKQIEGAGEYVKNIFDKLVREDQGKFAVVITLKPAGLMALEREVTDISRIFEIHHIHAFTKEELLEAIELHLENTRLTFSSDLQDGIFHASGGNPYLFQLISYFVFEQAKGRVAGLETLDSAQSVIKKTLHNPEGGYYIKLYFSMNKIDRMLLLTLARKGGSGRLEEIVKSFPKTAITKQREAEFRRVNKKSLLRHLNNLESDDVLSRTHKGGYTIRSRLFVDFLKRIMEDGKYRSEVMRRKRTYIL